MTCESKAIVYSKQCAEYEQMIRQQKPAWRRGMTLIELIVVITIIAVLVGLLLPAVVQMRQSARNTECRNNLKQLGVALYSHEARLEHLPKDGQNGWGFGAFILPEVEQSALYQQINPEQNPASPAYKPMIDTGLPVFLCPLFTRKGPKLANGAGRSSYMGNTELFSYGAMLEDIRDGASNTIMLAETNSVTVHGPGLVCTGN